jgi:dTDP-4-amino-4,6-dideoxygalactose transaminase
MAASSPLRRDPLPAGPIEFIDLKAQQLRLRGAIDQAIARVLDHGRYIMGPEVQELECQLATISGAKHAISCASGTDALLIAMMAKGVGPGDAVLCPAFTYTATPETIALLGATPVFVDVDPVTFNIDPSDVRNGLAAARAAGLTPRALIAVDLFGLPADYASLEQIAVEEGLWILSDAAQSFGARHGSRCAGAFGLISATSFFPAKPLGCYGDGGAIFTDDLCLADAMRSIRTHGNTPQDKYEIVRIGVNGRLDTIQAAILLEKLRIFPDEIVARQRIADRYTRGLSDIVETPRVPQGTTSVWAQYTIKLDTTHRRERLVDGLRSAGIPSGVYYPRPLHHQAAYRSFPTSGGLPFATRLAGTVLSLPMHPYLETSQQDDIVAAVRRTLVDA